MNQKGSAVIVLILVVILVTVSIIGGSFYIKNNYPEIIQKIPLIRNIASSNAKIPQNSTTPKTTTIPATTKTVEIKDETKNWKLYTSSKLGFSIKHPPDFSVEESSVYLRFRSPNLSHGDLETPIRTGGEILIWVENVSSTLEAELDKLSKPQLDCCPFVVKSKIKTTLSSTTAYKGVFNWGATEVYFVFSIKNGKSYNLTARVSESSKEEINKIFDLMVSTFEIL